MISIIVPVYNVANYIDKCIISILSQSFTDFECILVDDGSTDGSSAICDTWAEKDNRIKVFHTKNQGVSAARNLGIKHSTREYIYFIDGDDTCENDIFNIISCHDLYLGEYCHTDIFDNIILNRTHTKNINPNNYALSFLKEDIKACIGSFIIRKNILIKNNIYFNINYKYGEDLEFILKIIMHSKNIIIHNCTFVKYRQHSTSTMTKFGLDRFDVLYSRLELIEYAKFIGNYEVCNYIKYFSCIEAIITITSLLLKIGFPIKDFNSKILKDEIVQDILQTTIRNKNISINFRASAFCIYYNIHIYKFYILTISKYYKLRQFIAFFRRKILLHLK